MARSPKALRFPRRGEVWLVTLDPTVGHEIQKTRPAVVVQNDHSNRTAQTTIVAPLTSNLGLLTYPTEVLVSAGEGGCRVDSLALLRQLRCVDKVRLVKRLGTVRAPTLDAIDHALLITLSLVDL
jgi:mRNA interferase MazF